MSKLMDLTGQKFGRLTVVRRAKNTALGQARWLCRCDCGKKKIVNSQPLRLGLVQSCRCLWREKVESSFTDIAGKRFGKLTAVRRVVDGQGRSGKHAHWVCLCDCGKESHVILQSLVAGRTTSCGCKLYRRGPDSPQWKGGKFTTKEGYVRLYAPDHPDASERGYVWEHRFVMEKTIGRRLLRNETPHHMNGLRDDNRPENLELWVKPQYAGQRAKDLLAWARTVITTYAPLAEAKAI